MTSIAIPGEAAQEALDVLHNSRLFAYYGLGVPKSTVAVRDANADEAVRILRTAGIRAFKIRLETSPANG